MMRFLGLGFLALGLLAMPPMVSPADANLKSCLKGIKSCAKKGKKLKGAIKVAKETCQALRGCKKECRSGKKGCLSAVREGKLGSTYAKLCRKGKKACISTCKDLYKTPECREARDEVFTHAAEGGAKCSKALASCTPSPAIDCAAAILTCSGKEATTIKPLANTGKQLDLPRSRRQPSQNSWHHRGATRITQQTRRHTVETTALSDSAFRSLCSKVLD